MESLPPSYTSKAQVPSTTTNNNTNEPPPSNRSETEYPPLPYNSRPQIFAHYSILQEPPNWVLERRNDTNPSSHLEEQEQIIPRSVQNQIVNTVIGPPNRIPMGQNPSISTRQSIGGNPPPPAQRQLSNPFASSQRRLPIQPVSPTPIRQLDERNSHLLVQRYEPEIPTPQPQDFTTYMRMNGPPTSYEDFNRFAHEYEAHITLLAQTQGQNQNQEAAPVRSNNNNDPNNSLTIETPSQNTLTSNNTEPELKDLSDFSNFSSFLEWETELQRQTDLARRRNQGLNYEELNRTFNSNVPRDNRRQNTLARTNQVLDSNDLSTTTVDSFNSLIKSGIPGQTVSIAITNIVSGNSMAREIPPVRNALERRNSRGSDEEGEELKSNTRRSFIERYMRELLVLVGRRNGVRYEEGFLRDRAERIAERIG